MEGILMRNRFRKVGITVAVAVSVIALGLCSGGTLWAMPGKQPVAYVQPQDYLPVITLSGTPAEMGYQYGYQAAKYIVHNRDRLWKFLLTEHKFSKDEVVKDLMRYNKFTKELAPYLVEEIKGMVQGVKAAGYEVDFNDIFLLSAVPALAWARPAKEFRFDVPERCNAFAAWGSATKDGKPLLQINRMLGREFTYEVLIFGFPAKGHGNNFVTAPVAGCLASNWGANDKGLSFCLTAEPCFRKGDANYGLIIEMMFRHIIQKCSTFAEAEKFITTVKQGGACGSWLLLDKKSQHVVVERTAAHMGIRHSGDLGEKDYVVMANHFVSPEMIPSNILGKPVGPDVPMIGFSFWRYANLKQLIKERLGKIDRHMAAKISRNHDLYDSKKKQWIKDAIATEKTVCAHSSNIKGMVVTNALISLPADNEVFVLTGQPCGMGLPGGIGEYVKFKLNSTPQALNDELLNEARRQVSLAQYKLTNRGREFSLADLEVITAYVKKAADFWWKGYSDEKYAWLALEGTAPTNQRESSRLYGEAWTNFAKAQAYAKKAVRLIDEQVKR
jgi:predicted choloylglycine hydrolase